MNGAECSSAPHSTDGEADQELPEFICNHHCDRGGDALPALPVVPVQRVASLGVEWGRQDKLLEPLDPPW